MAKWTDKDVALLKAKYGRVSPGEIARELGRTRSQVFAKAATLRLAGETAQKRARGGTPKTRAVAKGTPAAIDVPKPTAPGPTRGMVSAVVDAACALVAGDTSQAIDMRLRIVANAGGTGVEFSCVAGVPTSDDGDAEEEPEPPARRARPAARQVSLPPPKPREPKPAPSPAENLAPAAHDSPLERIARHLRASGPGLPAIVAADLEMEWSDVHAILKSRPDRFRKTGISGAWEAVY